MKEQLLLKFKIIIGAWVDYRTVFFLYLYISWPYTVLGIPVLWQLSICDHCDIDLVVVKTYCNFKQ